MTSPRQPIDIMAAMTTLATSYSDVCTEVLLADTTAGNQVMSYLKIAKQTSSQKPVALIVGGMHACEWVPPDALLTLAEKLVKAYAANGGISYPAFEASPGHVQYPAFTVSGADVSSFAQHLEIWILPLANPDGREFNLEKKKNRDWRKNRRTIGAGADIGVDLNRNFDIAWDPDTYYSAGALGADLEAKIPALDGYIGDSPFSEAESRNIRDLIDSKRVTFFCDVHSFGRKILYPWALNSNQSTDPSKSFRNAKWNRPGPMGGRGGSGSTGYGEFFPNDPPQSLLNKHVQVAEAMKDAIIAAAGSGPKAVERATYVAEPALGVGYLSSGSSMDYAFSRPLVEAGFPWVHAFAMECGSDKDGENGFTPVYDNSFTKIEREVHAALYAFLNAAVATPVVKAPLPAPPPTSAGYAGPPLRVALPVAHEPGAATYSPYSDNGTLVFEVVDYFAQASCEGLKVKASPSAPSAAPKRLWNLYAFADGFLSLQSVRGKKALVLRLASELIRKDIAKHNSSAAFHGLTPVGPQLRHVLYVFDQPPGAETEDAVRLILADAIHPGRMITRIATPAGGTQSLEDFLVASSTNIDAVLQDFMAGTTEIFVEAGNAIGNFRSNTTELRFLDSCGSIDSANASAPLAPSGRATNPSYYLYLVRVSPNSSAVEMLTKLAPVGTGNEHPLDTMLSSVNVLAKGGKPAVAVDLSASSPPAPLLATVSVKKADNSPVIAGRGIPLETLVDFHESRNAAPSTSAAVRWRCYGRAPDKRADWGQLVSEPKKSGSLPKQDFFKTFPPTISEKHLVKGYWERYSATFNTVADRLEVPCEILLAIACTERPSGALETAEMSLVRLHPLKGAPGQIAQGSSQNEVLLAEYVKVVTATAPNHTYATIPIPWDGGAKVSTGTPTLTWAQLNGLVRDFPTHVVVSAGLMHTSISSARDDLQWLETLYGAGVVHTVSASFSGGSLTAETPPASLGDLLPKWLAVSDPEGDQARTRAQRALHSTIAGAAHVKRFYNNLSGGRNLASDFDFPTVASAYVNGAHPTGAAKEDNIDDEWELLFGLQLYDRRYAQLGIPVYNAAVRLFNDLPGGAAQPSVRLWGR